MGKKKRQSHDQIEGFLKKAGASVQLVTKEGEPLPEPEEEELLTVGRSWCRYGNADEAKHFQETAEDMIHAGQAERVAEICQQLLGENPGPETVALLSSLALLAQQATRTAMG